MRVHERQFPLSIQYRDDFPEDLRSRFDRHLARWIWLVPRWCNVVHVTPTFGGDDTVKLSIDVTPEYRFVVIYVHPRFFDAECSDEDRELDVVHELVHTANAPIADYAKAEIERLLPDAPLYRASLVAGLRRVLEAATEDLARAIVGRISSEGKQDEHAAT